MESNLNNSEFNEMLKNTTKIGNPKIKLSPFSMLTGFGESSKPFFGVFDNKSFYLTTNFSFFKRTSTPFILKGSYKPYDGKLRVEYIVEPRFKYQKAWWTLVAVLGFVLFNEMFFTKKTPTNPELFYIGNSFLIFMVCFAYWSISTSRKKLEKNFIKIFKLVK